jgi:hypothetical protein
MAKNIGPWLPRLFKENCCDEVVFAVREYDPSRYGALKRESIDRLALLRHNVAIAALRHWARRTPWPPFRAALRILRSPPYAPPADQPD